MFIGYTRQAQHDPITDTKVDFSKPCISKNNFPWPECGSRRLLKEEKDSDKDVKVSKMSDMQCRNYHPREIICGGNTETGYCNQDKIGC